MSPDGPPPIPANASRGRIAGKYELLEIAGRGGMANVWRAYQHGPGRFCRTVAVKQLYDHLAGEKLYRDMFLEEARIGAVLRDPNIAQIYDFIEHDGEHFLILEWIEGIELSTYIDYVVNVAKTKTRWESMVAVAIGMLRGLAAAHERVDEDGAPQPIVHRDVTPHNVLISVVGTARLIDFGLSLARDRAGEDTDPGIAKGKIAYLAPEVVRGGRPTPAADQFAAGAMLWEALAGRRLFATENQYETLRRVAEGQLVPLPQARDDLPDELYETVHRALALDVEDRFPSVRDMANRLGAILGQAGGSDTYEVLGRTVREARQEMELGHRSQGQRAETPVPTPQEESGIIELNIEDLEPTGARGLLPALLRKFWK